MVLALRYYHHLFETCGEPFGVGMLFYWTISHTTHLLLLCPQSHLWQTLEPECTVWWQVAVRNAAFIAIIDWDLGCTHYEMLSHLPMSAMPCRLKIPISVHFWGKSAIFTPLYLRNKKRCNTFLIKFGHGAPPAPHVKIRSFHGTRLSVL